MSAPKSRIAIRYHFVPRRLAGPAVLAKPRLPLHFAYATAVEKSTKRKSNKTGRAEDKDAGEKKLTKRKENRAYEPPKALFHH